MSRATAPPPIVIRCRKCGRVERGHNAANCGKTPTERALAARSKKP